MLTGARKKPRVPARIFTPRFPIGGDLYLQGKIPCYRLKIP